MNSLKTMSRFQRTALYNSEQSLLQAARNQTRGEYREAKNQHLAAIAWQALGRSTGLSGQRATGTARR